MTPIEDRILNVFNNLRNSCPSVANNFAILKLAVNPNNNQLTSIYQQKVDAHNGKILNSLYPDSGFDLFVPDNTLFDEDTESKFIDFQVKGEMLYCDVNRNNPFTCAFTIHPRSSISKTPLMLANHTGIIDSGYRGSLIGAFRWLRSSDDDSRRYVVEQNTRLLQVCHPTLCPVFVVLVREDDLSNTERGAGGFGSTGVGL
jgi:dUTP pyrophosphatase